MGDFEMLCFLYLLYLCYRMVLSLNIRQQRRWWVRPFLLERDLDGYFAATYLKLKQSDPEEFFKHTRMNIQKYEQLLELLKQHLTKKSIRPPIDFECRLAVTLS